ncbi:unnamed protein product, partial [Ectocarpus sp. 8 AP-2014]
MLRAPTPRSLRALRHAAPKPVSSDVGRVLPVASWVGGVRQQQQRGHSSQIISGGNSSSSSYPLVAAAVAAAAAAAAAAGVAAASTGSPAHAEGGVIPSATSVTPSPAGVPTFRDDAPPSPPGDDMDHNSVVVDGSSLAGGGGDGAGAGSGANSPPGPGAGGVGGGGGAEGAGDGDWGSKMGLQLSALFVQRALMVFRRERAAMRVVTPPIEFREEHLGGGPTLSASFHLPRSANILRVISAMVSEDQV